LLNSGNKKPLDLGIVDRVSGKTPPAKIYRIDEAWFGPGEPQAPSAPPAVKGRQWDYPAGYNLRMQPRGEEPIGFGQLRALALNCDLVRMAIETRKDQLCKLKITVRPKEDIPPAKQEAAESQAAEARKFLRKPDRVHHWNQWLRMLVGDMLTIDAATIYPRRNRGGGLYALEIMDGALIKPVVAEDGRVPEPPSPAYQQVMKGVVAADYTRQELLYFPRNPLSWRVYGLSPVEQIIITINIIIRRELHLLQYFTEGNLPDTLLEVPEGWGTEQIREFQAYWDSLFVGNTAMRRRGTWIFKGATPHQMKEIDLKNPVDEWFARKVCFCFSLSPQPFVAQINKATAETAQEMALSEGLAPLQEWVVDVVNEGLESGGFDLVEVAWEEETATKPKEQAEIDEIHVRSAIKRRSEIRKDLGLVDDGVPDFVLTVAGPVLLDEIGKEPPPVSSGQLPEKPEEPGPAEQGIEKPEKLGSQAEKLAKVNRGKKALKPIDRDRPEIIEARAALQTLMAKALKADMQAAAEQLAQGLGLAKAEEDQAAKIDRLLAELQFAGITATREEAAAILAKAALNGGLAAFAQIGFDDQAIVSQVNKLAVEWAENRAAELVTKIEESTRDYLRADVTQAVAEGWSPKQLSRALEENFGFSEARSDMIGRTEIAQADVEGNMMAYRASGVVEGKEWILGSEHGEPDECTDNAAEGPIPLDQAFSSGDMNPLAHPN
jgi:hypothetical protein